MDSSEFNYDKEVLSRIEEELINGIRELATPTSIKLV